jgi:hypothetical protein
MEQDKILFTQISQFFYKKVAYLSDILIIIIKAIYIIGASSGLVHV